MDVLESAGSFKLYSGGELVTFSQMENMREYINSRIKGECRYVEGIIYSDNVEEVVGL